MKKLFLIFLFLLIVPNVWAVESGYCKITKDGNSGYWRFGMNGAESFCDRLQTILELNTRWIGDNSFGDNEAEDNADFCDGWKGKCPFDVSEEIKNGKPTKTGSNCNEDWECSNWGECVNGEQNRVCKDSNYCGTNGYRPSETRECSTIDPINNLAQDEEDSYGNKITLNTILSKSGSIKKGLMAVGVAVILVILALLLVRRQ